MSLFSPFFSPTGFFKARRSRGGSVSMVRESVATYEISERPGSDLDAARLEYDLFHAAGYVGEAASRRLESYDRYPRTAFIVAKTQGKYCGVVRMIHPHETPEGCLHLPTLDDFEIYGWARVQLAQIPANGLVEIGTMSVLPEHRGRCSRILIRRIMTYCWSRHIWYALSSIDAHYFLALVSNRLPFKQIGEAEHYMGSQTVPTVFESHKLDLRYQPLLLYYRARHCCDLGRLWKRAKWGHSTE